MIGCSNMSRRENLNIKNRVISKRDVTKNGKLKSSSLRVYKNRNNKEVLPAENEGFSPYYSALSLVL